jgi:hypothetical protein
MWGRLRPGPQRWRLGIGPNVYEESEYLRPEKWMARPISWLIMGPRVPEWKKPYGSITTVDRYGLCGYLTWELCVCKMRSIEYIIVSRRLFTTLGAFTRKSRQASSFRTGSGSLVLFDYISFNLVAQLSYKLLKINAGCFACKIMVFLY